MPSAAPLNIPSSTPQRSSDAPSGSSESGSTPVASSPANGLPKTSTMASVKPSDISSPHELTAFVETLLEQLDANFDAMSNQMLEKMTQMSSRVDSLEAAIQDIISNEGATTSPSPVPSIPPSPAAPGVNGTTPSMRRTGSGL